MAKNYHIFRTPTIVFAVGEVFILAAPLKGRVQKKVWNFPYFSGVGGFEKVIFHKKIKIKNMV